MKMNNEKYLTREADKASDKQLLIICDFKTTISKNLATQLFFVNDYKMTEKPTKIFQEEKTEPREKEVKVKYIFPQQNSTKLSYKLCRKCVKMLLPSH